MPSDQICDICVVGGGVNGAGIARDAAGRGLTVTLLEQGDLSEGTSSRSGKLIHGGLRYLEYYEFRLVREALKEREVLLQSAPHIVWPLRFVLPHSPSDRPAWLVRAGLFLYDHLGGRKLLSGTRMINLRTSTIGDTVKPEFKRAFEYSDCWVDDARLTILNAVSAREKGATILTRTRCCGAIRNNGIWEVTTQDVHSGHQQIIYAKALVNAAGPWVNQVLSGVSDANVSDANTDRQVRLVKGSHLIIEKFWEGDHSYLIQNDDKRVIFINPYENDYALVGTTDIPYEGEPSEVKVDNNEIEYLLSAINRYFIVQLTSSDIVSSFSGVRPLFDDNSENPSAVSRDYIFDVDDKNHETPILSVFGGKITTYRKLAEHALNELAKYFPDMQKSWTANESLPGGDMPDANFESWLSSLVARHKELPSDLLQHYARLYGTRCDELLKNVTAVTDLGEHFGEQLYELEVRYLVNKEWAQTVEDVLERRTKHGVHLSTAEIDFFTRWFHSELQINTVKTA